ncbi:uncharacterized protein LOC113874771 [Abrus precatorius]|uniref:Uncharacterized protein LOC113874771 n=1 Tax=Abrus precatorius TaxID=3816 RepID=A0A8B8MJM2_ABRPR|nr:uncharacterized protein LOC113874771 [Abrus precatorius]
MAEANETLVLAKERTRRKDIFHHFQVYNGGWNISNDGYISSVLSTAVPFFAVAVAWFVIFGLFLLIMCSCYCCCSGEPSDYSKPVLVFSLIFLILCTIAAIGGCIVLYSGQGELGESTSKTLDYIVSQAQFVAENLKNASSYFDSAKKLINGVTLPLDLGKDIDHVKSKITTAADDLSKKTEDNSTVIHQGIDGMRLALIVVAAVMLFVAFLGFCMFVFLLLLLSVLGLEYLVYFLVVIGWILVASTFILCGVFLFVHNAMGDACVAMDEWVLNPTAHTALDEILPCVENATATETFSQSKAVTHKIVESFDGIISAVTNGNTVHYNQSGPLVPLLCDPFSSDFTVRQCAAGEVTLENATEVWKNYICQVSSSGRCTSRGRLTPTIYTELADAVNVTYGLFHHYGPFFIDLVDCTFVRKTFADISSNYCPGLRKYTKWIYFGSLVVSVAVMLSLIFCIVYVREWRHRLHAMLSLPMLM